MAKADFSGTWRSVCKYHSSSRDSDFTDEQTVHIAQAGHVLTVQSVGGKSRLSMELSIDGASATGTWQEVTDPDGYYKGATYRGALQLAIHPDNNRMAGKWLGIDKQGSINVGDWELVRDKR